MQWYMAFLTIPIILFSWKQYKLFDVYSEMMHILRWSEIVQGNGTLIKSLKYMVHSDNSIHSSLWEGWDPVAQQGCIAPLEEHPQSPPQVGDCFPLLLLMHWIKDLPINFPALLASAMKQNTRRKQLEKVEFNCSHMSEAPLTSSLPFTNIQKVIPRVIIGRAPSQFQILWHQRMDEIERRREIVRDKYALLRAHHPALPPVLRDFQVQGACVLRC